MPYRFTISRACRAIGMFLTYGGAMLPFYYLSVTTNLVMGLILLFSAKDKEEFTIRYPFLHEQTFLLVLVIFSGIAAIFKLLSPVEGSIPVIGDILPALAGLAGSIVFFHHWSTESGNELVLPPFLSSITEFERPIGYFCLAAGIMHLLFSHVLFL